MSKFEFSGGISGTNVQVGDHNVQQITMNQADRDLVAGLIELLGRQVQAAPLPEETKQALTAQVLPAMQAAVQQPDPKPGLTQGLAHLNANLEQVKSTAGSVAGIVGTVAKIAHVIGTGVSVVAPFLARLL
jgi:hypothetical protein